MNILSKRAKLIFLFIIPYFINCSNLDDNEIYDLPEFMLWNGSHTLSDSLNDKEIEAYLGTLYDHNIKGIFLNSSNDFFKRIAPMANKIGIQIHAWRPTMVRFDKQFMEKHKYWYAVNKNGISCIDKPPYVGYYRWLCPTEPMVLEFLKNEYLELAQIEGISGIHFDYIRYCDIYLPVGLQPKYNLVQEYEMPEFDFCYCHRCREKFKLQFGRDPIEIEDPANDLEWKNWRLKQIVTLVNTISEEVKRKTNRHISAAVFPTPQMSIDMVRQDWGNFKIDAVTPMLYNGFYNEKIEWIGQCVSEGIKTMNVEKNLHAGLFLADLKDTSDFRKAIDISLKNGANGVVFFAAHNITDEQLEIIKNYVKE